MINNNMKIRDILMEGPADCVARFYKEASADAKKFYNPEDEKYRKKNREYYTEHFLEWYKNETVPIFTKPTTKPQPEYTNHPKQGKIQSAGYRGQQYALAAAGLPYDHNVQRYEPNLANIVATQTDIQPPRA